MPPTRRSTRAVTSTAATSVAPYATASNSRTNARYTSSASPGPSPASASLDRTANSKLRLTVKAPPSKLRQATSSAQADSISANADTSESDATPVPASGMRGGSKDGNGRSKRSTRNPRTVIDPDSEEPDDDEDEDMEDVGAVNEELLANEDSEEDAEGGEDEEEDELSGGHPPPPVIKQTGSKGGDGKPGVVVTAPPEGPLKSVEAKEVDEESGMEDDEELSELEEENEEEEEEIGNDLEDLEDEEEGLSDEDEGGSRSGTPDLSKLTRRQRGAFEEVESNGLMALSNEAQKKKHLTAEENAMRRAEMARRRKNLSEKRNEEEKMDTINKLLNKPAPKRRTRAEIIRDQQIELMAAAGGGTPGTEERAEERADPLFTRYIQRANGNRVLAVPEEWREGISGVGGSQVLFMKGQDAKDAGMSSSRANMASGRMVEEVA
ncbi:hypothetical protein KC332_g7938 [Hortaea werneckii]|uniref:INO80 complex subunit B-like conserved region domain-containing protein n=2 Tax=Hortaea werneckii TaxID=91943 RepID=A0A3M7IIY1_HORWE|nr:hypothetical protein KC358_g12937 [Hortaea werneckii]OTA28155.1 hypothetical protein BTJ68_10881 [Hortaea werneckii EXF-2000]KAI6810473.1 hypothetical protein KC350_g12519 [Hortaea werneckii]KAI6833193.1 hypothetical protein KC342_g6904 [Hortaea werneckii]KAI6924991.1 hypothetical protein KC341_g13715 [Hortaea werneckii]